MKEEWKVIANKEKQAFRLHKKKKLFIFLFIALGKKRRLKCYARCNNWVDSQTS